MANPFKVADKVRTAVGTGIGARFNGKVAYIACTLATKSGGKTCDKKTCTHPVKDYLWVLWPGGGLLYSVYHYSELASDSLPAATEPSSDKEPAKGDPYMEKAKEAIKNLAKDILAAKKQENEFWRTYNGFTSLRRDRSGRTYVHETEPTPKPPLKENEIDWDVYRGFKKGPLRKSSLQ